MRSKSALEICRGKLMKLRLGSFIPYPSIQNSLARSK